MEGSATGCLCAQASSFLRVNVCAWVCVHGSPLVDWLWRRQTRFSSPCYDPGQGALTGQLWERGEGRRRPQRPERGCPQPCRLLGAPQVMSTLGSRDRLCAPQTGLVTVGVRSPAREPDSLVQSLSPLLGHLDILGSWCETRCAFISTLPICKMGPQELLPPTKSRVPRNSTCWHLCHTCQHQCPSTPVWGSPAGCLVALVSLLRVLEDVAQAGLSPLAPSRAAGFPLELELAARTPNGTHKGRPEGAVLDAGPIVLCQVQ